MKKNLPGMDAGEMAAPKFKTFHGERTISDAHWTAEEVVEATKGTWLAAPPAGWSASGLCIHASTMRHGHLAVLRPPGDAGRGIPLHTLVGLKPPPAAVIAAQIPDQGLPDLPVLQVRDTDEAILGMGRHARDQMTSTVLAVTGSAGKTTTVAMLAHVLSIWEDTPSSSHSANLPHGVAWNLASMPRQTRFVVLELAIGRMGQSSRLARPHLSLVTNILPAHLGENSTLKDIALTKSAIFSGMAPGGVAVLNRDMLEWETVHSAAVARNQKVVHYGTTRESAFQLLEYDTADQRALASIAGKKIEYRMAAAGKHMALNGLAVLAAVSALGLPIEPAVKQLECFSPLPGRGEEFEIVLAGRRVAVIDDAYNANPGSMAAALENLASRITQGRKIAVLGEMAELGPGAPKYHSDLALLVKRLDIDRFYCIGKLYEDFFHALPSHRQGYLTTSLDDLRMKLTSGVSCGDTLLFKGSHSTEMHKLVASLKQDANRTRDETGETPVRCRQI
ncbi:UDP-N-acetylmuramoyl-tripeptide--D-alanyl-D-alanine ligase [Rhizobium sp. LC145]|uniref:UDP-N-acetylmuramoyl-tripeptide--D-alanyl-D- alanine ligase n=1 Tax=Rhizobium sp. LC145 TaxID=1120688 RepID=UPI0009E267C4|nr:UDP-N-acetylmuramoyl-tripeptide--D-alanyl-D-alanine ligase [Rhizobium sp. LC145]TKT55951.1 UDP-N-acetylmuramoyl-tripeptide--D-alanyl-D-alanine ligase [Rhizobiaceae bacterium LC148]